MKNLTIIFALLLSNVVYSSVNIKNDKIYKDLDNNISYSFDVCKNFKSKYVGVEFTVDSVNYQINDYKATGANWLDSKLHCEFTEINYLLTPNKFSISPEKTLITSSGGNIYPFVEKYSPLLNELSDKTINLLFIYDLKTSMSKYNIELLINSQIKEIEDSLMYSNISNINLKNIGIISVDSSITKSDYKIINSAIVNGHSGFENIPSLMNKYGADFYVFINDERILDQNNKYVAGSVYEIMGSTLNSNGNLINDKNKINGMVIWSGETGTDLTFSHEMGHLLGLWHDFSTDKNKILPYAKGKSASTEEINNGITNYGTIMSYEDSQYLKQYFSNPYNSNCNGAPCGVNKYENNGADAVAALNITLPQILEFRDRNPNTPKPNIATSGDDIIDGTDGDDVIDTLAGDDIVYGSKSPKEDKINFSNGSNKFYIMDEFEMGNTVIINFRKNDRLVFKMAMPFDFEIIRSVDDLLLKHMMGYTITIKDFYKVFDKYIIEFDMNLGHEVLKGLTDSNIIGTDNNDILGDSNRTSEHYLINEGAIDSTTRGYVFKPLKGVDLMYGSRYGDTYIFSMGDYTDTIIDYSCGTIQENTKDTIQFLDYLEAEVEYEQSSDGMDLILRHSASASGWNTVVVENYFDSSGCYKIEEVKFKDGSVVDLSTISFEYKQPTSCFTDFVEGYNYVCGTEGNDAWGNDLYGAYNLKNIMYGFGGTDFIRGGSKSDILYGGNGNDYLYSGHGNDQLYGGSGKDTLHDGLAMESNSGQEYWGGADYDSIYGTKYKDTYHVESGDGSDFMADYSCVVDDVVFGENIEPSNVNIYTKGSGSYIDIYINYGSGELKIPGIGNANLSTGNCVAFVNLKFKDGTIWTWNEVLIKAGYTSNKNGSLLL